MFGCIFQGSTFSPFNLGVKIKLIFLARSRVALVKVNKWSVTGRPNGTNCRFVSSKKIKNDFAIVLMVPAGKNWTGEVSKNNVSLTNKTLVKNWDLTN